MVERKGRSTDIIKGSCHVKNPKGHIRRFAVIEMKPRDKRAVPNVNGLVQELEHLQEERLATQPKRRKHRR